jgi:hypothetical protein
LSLVQVQGGAQLGGRCGRLFAELRIAAHGFQQPLGGAASRLQVAAEMHAAHHALARELICARLERRRFFRNQDGKKIGHRIAECRVPAGV